MRGAVDRPQGVYTGPEAGLSLRCLANCSRGSQWHSIDVSSGSPPLDFMTRASDGERVTAIDYHGRVMMLYFGYTYCPDVCPTTLSNVAEVLKRLRPDVQHVCVLFVAVDPNHDMPSILAEYVAGGGAPRPAGLTRGASAVPSDANCDGRGARM